ncbi:MAG TPA: type I-C CRISPR-associated protein Cas7/Csd2 [Terriglobales bacterium]
MPTLSAKIDFAIILQVRNANPNGDPLNGNRPRTDYSGLGEITDVCLKRKIRDRLVERYQALLEDKKKGQGVFVQSDDRKIDEAKSLRERADAVLSKEKDSGKIAKSACETWLDVRTFGQLFAFKPNKKKKAEDSDGDTGVSIGIRGPVTIQSAFSIEPVSISSTQITKSVSGEGDGSKRGSDTMGMKHRVDAGVYVTFGSMNPQLAVRTGFSDHDAETVKTLLPKLFENDASSARPEGSMEVKKVIWWKHSSKAGQYSSAKVHRSLSVKADGTYVLASLDGLTPEEIDGF